MGASRLGAACSYSASALADVDMGAASPGKRKRDELEEAAAAAAASADAASASASAGEESAAAGGGSGGGSALASRLAHVAQAQPRVASCSEDSSKSSDERSGTASRSCSQTSVSVTNPPSEPPRGAVAQSGAACSSMPAPAAAQTTTLAGSATTATDVSDRLSGDGALLIGGGDAAGLLGGLPLRGCVLEYVQRWGWATLPQGTEQMLRDILQTLYARMPPRLHSRQIQQQTPLRSLPRPLSHPPVLCTLVVCAQA